MTNFKPQVLFSLLGLLLGSCSAHPQPVLEHVEAPPHRFRPATPTERFGSANLPEGVSVAERSVVLDESASSAFLEAEMARRAAEGPIKEPPPRRTVYVPDYSYQGDLRDYEYDYDYRSYRAQPLGYRSYNQRRGFPLGSALFGAGLGAIIGHQSGRRDRGAAIGAGLGYLLGR